MKTTARNELKGIVNEVIEGIVMAEVRVEVSPSIFISATITKEGFKNMGISLGDEVYVLIKASSMILSKRKMKATARNILKGKIEKIIKGAVNSEVKLSIGENLLCAVVTNEAIEELQLKEQEETYAVFKASSVILVA